MKYGLYMALGSIGTVLVLFAALGVVTSKSKGEVLGFFGMAAVGVVCWFLHLYLINGEDDES